MCTTDSEINLKDKEERKKEKAIAAHRRTLAN